MKKLLALLVAIVYISSSVGATVHLHYCMDKLVNWSLSDKEDDKCDNCGMEKDGGCCKDEQQFIKNDADQKTAGSAFQLLANPVVATPVHFTGETIFYTSLIEKYSVNEGPPIICGVDILIRNCAFRI